MFKRGLVIESAEFYANYCRLNRSCGVARWKSSACASYDQNPQGEHAMTENMIVLDPVAQPSNAPAKAQQVLDGLAGKTVGFIDNAKLNFNHLVDDLGELLVSKYGVARVVKHRKSGQVPVEESVLKEYVERCDAVITGSGD